MVHKLKKVTNRNQALATPDDPSSASKAVKDLFKTMMYRERYPVRE